jgi:hypothetical protein
MAVFEVISGGFGVLIEFAAHPSRQAFGLPQDEVEYVDLQQVSANTALILKV